MASIYRRVLKSAQRGSSPTVREGLMRRGHVPYAFVVLCLLLTAYCSLLTVCAQPGAPQPNSPLYGARTEGGSVSTGLPKALKSVGIDQRLNEQIPLDAVFKDEQGREVRLGQFFSGKPVVLS